MSKKKNTYDLSGEFGIGYTSNTNEPFYFDLEDYELIKEFCWRKDNKGYIVTDLWIDKKNQQQSLHRLVMNCKKFEEKVDHIFHKRNDNRKNQLRICHNSENIVSRKSQGKIIGICYRKDHDAYVMQIQFKKERIFKEYKTEQEAIKARLEAEAKYFKQFAPQKHLFKQYGVDFDE